MNWLLTIFLTIFPAVIVASVAVIADRRLKKRIEFLKSELDRIRKT